MYLQCLRYTVTPLMVTFFIESVRTLAILLVGHVLVIRNDLRNIFKMSIGSPSLFRYNQFCVIFSRADEFYKVYLILFFAFVSLGIMGFIMIAISLLVDYENFSREGLWKWKKQIAYRFKGMHRIHYLSFMKKSLGTVQVTASPIGSVGVVNGELQTNYFSNTLEFTIGSIIASEGY